MSLKRLAALALAASYLADAHCRLACAGMISAPPPAAAGVERQDDQAGRACHHPRKTASPPGSPEGRSLPCCMNHFDGAPALVSADVSAAIAPLFVSAVQAAAGGVRLPLVRLCAYAADHAPPAAVAAIAALSSRGPRAPPCVLAVL